MTQQVPAIEIDAEFPDTAGTVTGTFEFLPGTGDAVTEGIETPGAFQNKFSNVSGILLTILASGEPKRKGLDFDPGGGRHYVDIAFEHEAPHEDASGTPYQWGDSSSAGLTARSATGQGAIEQANVFNHYLRVARTDSTTPARLTWGEYTSSGVLDPLDVVVVNPQTQVISGEGDKLRGQLRLHETIDAETTVDALINSLTGAAE